MNWLAFLIGVLLAGIGVLVGEVTTGDPYVSMALPVLLGVLAWGVYQLVQGTLQRARTGPQAADSIPLRCRLFGHKDVARTRLLHDPDSVENLGTDNDVLKVCERCGEPNWEESRDEHYERTRRQLEHLNNEDWRYQ